MASFPGRCCLRLSELGADESGQGMVEYAFIIVMVALVVILTVLIIGNQTKNMWQDISNTLTGH
ncbi:MAG TPA: Flp family type IVb pilin [Candidatus Dormibacteraeota bacterium]|nr:Flp family type IVb pilin [Candidatus Dormibacteraeota bacterium]